MNDSATSVSRDQSQPASNVAETLQKRLLDLAKQASREALLHAAVEVAPRPLEPLLNRVAGTAFVWAPNASEDRIAFGEVETISESGPERFERTRQIGQALLSRLCGDGITEQKGAPAPRLYGGFAFQLERACSELWKPFGEACFVLPELSYVRQSSRAWLSVIAPATNPQLTPSQRARVEQCVTFGAGPGSEGFPEVLERSFAPGKESWIAQVSRLCQDIHRGRFEKVVAARRLSLRLDRPASGAQVLRGLRSGDAAVRFLFRREESQFLGATPERLLSLRGRQVETEALAGSIRTGGARELMESDKELAEHAIVVRDIIAGLEPFVRELQAPERPQVRELNYVLHLQTPIAAELLEPRHVLELLERLHPTAAVAGVPRKEALAWIQECEPEERGWYAGPVGWFDASGDGDFYVALRSGVLSAEYAHLYAGAGIVAGSDPVREHDETELKLKSLLGALGVRG